MLNSYIKNRGITQTIIRDNNQNHFNQLNWDTEDDGNIANISIQSNYDGKQDQFNVSLDNNDLANILNIPSVNIPLDKRLNMDFEYKTVEKLIIPIDIAPRKRHKRNKTHITHKVYKKHKKTKSKSKSSRKKLSTPIIDLINI